jgi:hypothetical protein
VHGITKAPTATSPSKTASTSSKSSGSNSLSDYKGINGGYDREKV